MRLFNGLHRPAALRTSPSKELQVEALHAADNESFELARALARTRPKNEQQ
jgi:hypothetical protein